MIQFTVSGEPVGKGRPKFSTANGMAMAYTPQKTVNYENLVKISYYQQCGKNKPFDKDVPLKALIVAYFPIPKSVSKKKRDAMMRCEVFPTKKPDTDNLIKSILDALNSIAYHDDSQIVSVSADKYYSDRPRVEITISEI